MLMDLLSRSLGKAGRYLHHGRRLVWADDSLLVFAARAVDVRPQVPTLDAGVPWSVVDREVRSIDAATAAGLPSSLRAALPYFAPDARLHTVHVDGELAAWGFSAFPTATWPLVETATTLEMPPASGCLTAFETVPRFRGRRLYPTLIVSMLDDLFGRGAAQVFIWCRSENHASRAAIARVGFRQVAEHALQRRFGVSRSTRSGQSGGPS